MICLNENKEIEDLLTDYDKNNANQKFLGGTLEYNLFENISKRMLDKFLSPEWVKAEKAGFVYAHDKAQYLFKGINCFQINPRFIIRKGLSTYGDNNDGVVSKPPKHFRTALELLAQCMGLASSYCAGGQAIAMINTALAPFMEKMTDKQVKQDLQAFMFQLNQSFMNRGCVVGDTEIYVRLNGKIELKNFNEISELLGAEYGWNDVDIDLEVLTVDDDRDVVWVKPSRFVKNEVREIYKVELPHGKSFKCDDAHGLIRFSNLEVVNIKDIKKGTQLADPRGINFDYTIIKDNDYWNGVLYGFWLGDGYKTGSSKNRTCITVATDEKKQYLSKLFNNLDIDYTFTETDKKTDERHLISKYHNYYFDKSIINNYELDLDNINCVAGVLAGLLASDGYIGINKSTESLNVQLQITNKEIADLFRYALFFFGVRCNLKITEPRNNKHSISYKLNAENTNYANNILKQLDLRETQEKILCNIRDMQKSKGKISRTYIKSITKTGNTEETYCFEVNGRMIIGSDFILTSNSQPVFSSVNMDLEMPAWLKTEIAYGKGGKEVGYYGDFIDEAKRFVHLLNEVAIEGDGNDKPLFFPNLIYNIPNADLNEWKDLFELSAKFSSPYFCNYTSNGVDYQSSLGCRSCLPSNWSGNPNIDCMGTGNSVYTTLVLPALALQSKTMNKNFFELMKYYMGLIREFNKQRLCWIYDLWYKYHTADFMIQELDGVPLYRLDDATIVMGYVGLSEALEILYGKDITECNRQARVIMKFMRDEIAKWKKEDNLRWGLFQTPAENLAYTSAKKMVEQYGFKQSKAKGTKSAPFYTNSNHVPVDNPINLIERIKIEGNNQPLGAAGNIMNVYLGEAYSEPSALKSLAEKIRDNTDAYFWAFTGDFSLCPVCNTKYKGIVEECAFCGSTPDVFSRVTGYLTVTKSWNKGKQQELKMRHRYGSE